MPTEELDTTTLGHDELLAEIVRRLIDAHDPARVYLFGSRARGDKGPYLRGYRLRGTCHHLRGHPRRARRD